MPSPELWRGTVERLGWGGQGLARAADGRLILLSAPLALVPGEEVEAQVNWRARHGEGEVTRWLQADPRRLPDVLPHPGYPLLGVDETLAAVLKRGMAEDLLRRMLPGIPEWHWLAAPPRARRSRIQLHWDGARLGPHARGTHAVVEFDIDPLAAPELSAAIPVLRRALQAGGLPAQPARWELATGTPPGDVRASVGGTTWRLPAGMHSRALPPLPDEAPLLHHLGAAVLQQQPRAFFQACPEWAWEAFGQVLGGWRLNGTLLFDLYGGGGFFSRLLAGAYQRSLLVETSALAIADARANLAGMQADIQEADVARWLASQQGSWASPADTVLLDPPRAGLPPAVSQRLAECSAGQIILVGCDGAAFCRDIRRLCEQGRWRLAQLAILDLFPFTPAVECIGLLRREAG